MVCNMGAYLLNNSNLIVRDYCVRSVVIHGNGIKLSELFSRKKVLVF